MDGSRSKPLQREPVHQLFDGGWARELAKHLAPTILPTAQLAFQTPFGPYVLDLLLQLGSLRVGIKCSDDVQPGFLGLWQDAALVGCSGVNVIYRFRSQDLRDHLEDCLFVVALSDPQLFTSRGQIILRRLASDSVQRCWFPKEEVTVEYPRADDDELDADPSGDPSDVFIEARPRETESTLHILRRDRAALWPWYDFVRRTGAQTAHQAMQFFAAEHLRPDEGRICGSEGRLLDQAARRDPAPDS